MGRWRRDATTSSQTIVPNRCPVAWCRVSVKRTSMNELPESIRRQIPEAVIRRVDTLDPVTQEAFLSEFRKKKKSALMAFLLWCIFPAWHYFYLGKVWVNLIFWLTFGGFGLWWLIDLFRLGGMVREYNKTVAISVLKDIRFLETHSLN